ncbi:MAG TPA: choice-of-anchor P family protein [Solimonas sp.]|nr:choice-of-anchor P family protein [Solimonas sp.]
MKSSRALVVSGAILAALLGLNGTAAAHLDEPTRYSGRATVIDAKATALTVKARAIFGDTGELDPNGQTKETTAVAIDNPAPLFASSRTIDAITSGANNTAASRASVEKLQMKIGTLTLAADVIEANAYATCDRNSMTVATSGNSTITNLTLNGKRYAVTGKPNQKITLIGLATVIINEQSNPDVNTMSVNAIHVIVPGSPGVASADVVISHAQAGILSCPCNL